MTSPTNGRRSRAASPHRSRRRDEEQLELVFAFEDDRVVPMTRTLDAARADPAAETRAKRLKNGVLVQIFLK